MVAGLLDGGEYRRSRLLAAWGHAHPWRMLASRLEDCGLPLPSHDTSPGKASLLTYD